MDESETESNCKLMIGDKSPYHSLLLAFAPEMVQMWDTRHEDRRASLALPGAKPRAHTSCFATRAGAREPQRSAEKKAARSAATAAGCSAGAKCPPRGNTVHRLML